MRGDEVAVDDASGGSLRVDGQSYESEQKPARQRVRRRVVVVVVALLVVGAWALVGIGADDESDDEPSAVADGEGLGGVTTLAGAIPVREGAYQEPGTPLGAGFEVAEGSVLVGDVFPSRYSVVHNEEPIEDDGWVAVLLLVEDAQVVLDRYIAQARDAGLEVISQNVTGACREEDALLLCEVAGQLGALQHGRGVRIEVFQGPATGQMQAQSHLVVTYFEAGEPPYPNQGPAFADAGRGAAAPSAVPEVWEPLARPGEPIAGDPAVLVPDGTTLAAPAAGRGFVSTRTVLEVTGDPETVLRAVEEQTGSYPPGGVAESWTDDGFEVWHRTWTTGHTFAASVFQRQGQPTWLLIDHFPAD